MLISAGGLTLELYFLCALQEMKWKVAENVRASEGYVGGKTEVVYEGRWKRHGAWVHFVSTISKSGGVCIGVA